MGAGERRVVEGAGDVTLSAVGVGCDAVGTPVAGDVGAGELVEGEHAINKNTRSPTIAVNERRPGPIINRL
jgi:hypothetical protein